uniref:Uncharacterized protein n=1 Tax=Timema poppense TaxID=170557 RepID=A0A7R9DIV2_TIMPO|nr:unnamed protein product [Timema poppensis]
MDASRCYVTLDIRNVYRTLTQKTEAQIRKKYKGVDLTNNHQQAHWLLLAQTRYPTIDDMLFHTAHKKWEVRYSSLTTFSDLVYLVGNLEDQGLLDITHNPKLVQLRLCLPPQGLELGTSQYDTSPAHDGKPPPVHLTEIRTSISTSGEVHLITTLANYATEAGGCVETQCYCVCAIRMDYTARLKESKKCSGCQGLFED